MSPELNPHYNFNDPQNNEVIKTTEKHNKAWIDGCAKTIEQAERIALNGAENYEIGVNVVSPWGENQVVEAQINDFDKNEDHITKAITINPGYMLSLQKHRGREEFWEVIEGTLTIIRDGVLYTLSQGENITIPTGSVHGLANQHKTPVKLIETQMGVCREADNIRLLDFNNRPTMPLQNKNEALSAILYTETHLKIEKEFNCNTKPNMVLLSSEYKNLIDSMT